MAWALNNESYAQRSMGGEQSRDKRCIVLIVLSIQHQEKSNDALGERITYSYELPTVLLNKVRRSNGSLTDAHLSLFCNHKLLTLFFTMDEVQRLHVFTFVVDP